MANEKDSLHTGGVTGSIPVAPTISATDNQPHRAPAGSTEQEHAPSSGGNLGEPVPGPPQASVSPPAPSGLQAQHEAMARAAESVNAAHRGEPVEKPADDRPLSGVQRRPKPEGGE